MDLKKNGIDSNMKNDVSFLASKEIDIHPDALLSAIKLRSTQLKKQDKRIRLEDIVYIQYNKAYFTDQVFGINMLVNDIALKNEAYNKIVSELITIRARVDKEILKPILYDSKESYYFVLYSEHLTLDQWVIESFLSIKKKGENNFRDVFEIGKEIDGRVHTSNEEVELVPEKVVEDDGSLEKSLQAIIKGENFLKFDL